MALAVKGRISHIPILTGATTDESFTQSDKLEPQLKYWYPALTTQDVAALGKLYPDSDFLSHQDAVNAAVGETLNRCAVCTHSFKGCRRTGG
jgi:hypothetical protein